MEAFITDSTTVEAFVAEQFNRHPAVTFSFRPSLIEERAALIQKLDSISDKASSERTVAVALHRLLKVWSLSEEEIKIDQVLRLHPALMTRMASIVVWGSEGGDVNPKSKTEDKLAKDETESLSVLNSTGFADALDESTTKNSSTD